ncbi:hypothetical protein CALVIDRAFT_537052 [Calocera viscosa TUFC12733]|uniref:F-box domain-containing protein n=1 Tax=Calocera viscosa (strain TUFC12733) TaxID=1330018 RepID=A0A167MHA0_CALVF|nr:hypothetical protein CALVIDRAFT_537052 [Calocera viscosa TUFC12733]
MSNLQKLDVCLEAPNNLFWALSLLSPSMVSFNIRRRYGKMDPNMEPLGTFTALVNDLPKRTPCLRNLRLELQGSSDEHFDAALGSAVNSLPHLAALTLALKPTPALFASLSASSTLRTLIWDNTGVSTPSYSVFQSESATFEELVTLVIVHLSEYSLFKFFEAYQFPALKRLQIFLGYDQPLPYDKFTTGFTTLLQAVAERGNLRELDVRLSTSMEQGWTLDPSKFQPLLACHRMLSLRLVGVPRYGPGLYIAWEDQHLVEMATNWPELEELTLLSGRGDLYKTAITLSSFVRLSTQCPHLTTLGIPVNIEAFDVSSRLPCPAHQLRKLILGGASHLDGTMELQIAAGTFICQLFPNAQITPKGLRVTSWIHYRKMFGESARGPWLIHERRE